MTPELPVVKLEEDPRRPDVLPVGEAPQPVRPPTPVVSGSHVLATASGGLDFEKKSVYFDLTAVGQDDLTVALLAALLDGSVRATAEMKHDVTGLKLRVSFEDDTAFDAVAPMAEDARRKRAGLPTVAEEALAAQKQAQAVVAEEQAAKAAVQTQADVATKIVSNLSAENEEAKRLLAENATLASELVVKADELAKENAALKEELAKLTPAAITPAPSEPVA